MSGADADDQLGPEAQFLQRLHDLEVTLWTGGDGFGGAECSRPPDWQNLTYQENMARLQRFHPVEQSFICANTGIPTAVFDSDTKNGGDPEKVRALLTELGERIYGEVDTPSGGKHFYITGHPDLPTVHSKADDPKLPDYPGLDIQSHGANVFTPGTLRSKYGGSGYTIVLDELDQMPVTDGDEPTPLTDWVAEQLECSVRTKARKTSGGASKWAWDPCEPWDGTPPDKRQSAYLHAAVTGEADKVAKTASGGRNDAIFEAALKLGSYVSGAGLDEPVVIAALEGAAETNGHTAEDGIGATRASIGRGCGGGSASRVRCRRRKSTGKRPAWTPTDRRRRSRTRKPNHRPTAASTVQRCWRTCAPGSPGSSWWWTRPTCGCWRCGSCTRTCAIELYTTPRLLIDSIAPGSGKTTVLEHLDHLCLNRAAGGGDVVGRADPPILEKEMRTILLDEIQRTLVEGKPGVDEVIAVINSGYRRGATRPVLVPKGRDWVLQRPAHLRPAGDGGQLAAPAPGRRRPVDPDPADARHRRPGRGLRLGGTRRRRQGAAATGGGLGRFGARRRQERQGAAARQVRRAAAGEVASADAGRRAGRRGRRTCMEGHGDARWPRLTSRTRRPSARTGYASRRRRWC